MPRPRIVVVCPTDRDREHAARPEIRDRFELEFAGSLEEVLRLDFDERRFTEVQVELLRARRGDLSGVVGTDDFPASFIAAILGERLDLPAPSSEAVFLCQHKYWSRVAQRAAAPAVVPAFAAVDLRSPLPRLPPLPLPCFAKPVKSMMSELAERVDSPAALEDLAVRARGRLPLLARGFDDLVECAGLLPRYGSLGAATLLCEELLEGRQVTVDAYACGGRVIPLGAVDSWFYAGTSSFQRFQLPSVLPALVQRRMADAAARCARAVGLDRAVFNVELIWNEATDAVHVVEINGRMASQFVPLYRAVRDVDLYALQLELAAGGTPRVPEWIPERPPERVAASFALRRAADARALRVPSSRDLAALAERFPGAHCELLVAPGELLSEYLQDGSTYRYALLDLAAASERELETALAGALELLRFEFDPPLTAADRRLAASPVAVLDRRPR